MDARQRRLVTSRYGVSPTGSGLPGGPGGASVPPYDSFNLGAGVGDEPAAVGANRAALAAEMGLAPSRLIWMSQVHGTVIAEISGPTVEPVAGTDGMVSTATGIGLAVLVADCVPVLAVDPVAGVIGVAHAGRLGAAAGIGPALIGRMVALGAAADQLEVLLGPAICGRCYEVPPGMRDEVDGRLPGSACLTAANTAGLDLRAGLRRQLHELGVAAVQTDARCTREDPMFFSHRRAAPTGRFAAVVRQ